MRLKPGVSVRGLLPEVLLAVQAAEGIWRRYNAEAVITSGTEAQGGHKPHSAHWTGRAVDLRVKNVREDLRPIVAAKLAESLGREYDVLHEGQGEAWEHVHVEFDPEGPT